MIQDLGSAKIDFTKMIVSVNRHFVKQYVYSRLKKHWDEDEKAKTYDFPIYVYRDKNNLVDMKPIHGWRLEYFNGVL